MGVIGTSPASDAYFVTARGQGHDYAWRPPRTCDLKEPVHEVQRKGNLCKYPS